MNQTQQVVQSNIQVELNANVPMPSKRKNRRDKFNVPIQKGQKVHRMVFRDQYDKKQDISDVHVVENWKQFNVENEQQAKTSCSCLLF